ncbi:MAG TPA: tyrosine-type recombinase/integrase [Pyrinomonadaceae bacterium]|nr:tyrosine-type recombinase/integrase [Pyrinomonadaceae bacterium]
MDALLEKLDERMRRIAEEVAREAGPAPTSVPMTTDLIDEKTRRQIAEQLLLSNKHYLTRAQAAAYLGVSQRSIKEWADRPADQNPFPEVRAGADPRYKRTAIDQWTVERFKLEHSKALTRQDRQFKPGTVNQRLNVLSAILSRAVALRFIRDNPCSGVERLPVEAEEARTLSYEEEGRLTEKLLEGPQWVHDATRVALGTGFRITEVLSLTRDSVDFIRGLLFVSDPKWKNDPRRTLGVPMSAEVREILLRLDRDSPTRALFIHPGTGRRPSRGSFYNQLRSACESVGIFGIHPHSLRHTFGTRLGEADVNVKKIQRLMGHADIKMTLRYIHPGEEGLRAVVELAAGKRPGIVPGDAAASPPTLHKPLRAVG